MVIINNVTQDIGETAWYLMPNITSSHLTAV